MIWIVNLKLQENRTHWPIILAAICGHMPCSWDIKKRSCCHYRPYSTLFACPSLFHLSLFGIPSIEKSYLITWRLLPFDTPKDSSIQGLPNLWSSHSTAIQRGKPWLPEAARAETFLNMVVAGKVLTVVEKQQKGEPWWSYSDGKALFICRLWELWQRKTWQKAPRHVRRGGAADSK